MILVKDLISQITGRQIGSIPIFDAWLESHKGKPLAIRHSTVCEVKNSECVGEKFIIVCNCNECGDQYTVILEYTLAVESDWGK